MTGDPSRDPFGPTLKDLTGPSLKDLTGPTLKDLMGPTLKDPMGPSLKDLMGPTLKDLMGPTLKDLMGPSLKDLTGPTLSVRFAQAFSSPSVSTEVFRDFGKLTSSLTAANLVDLTLGSQDQVDDPTATALGSFAHALADVSDTLEQTLASWVAHVGSVPRVKLILYTSAAVGALLKFFDTPESTRNPDAFAINLLAVLVAVGWLLYTVHEAKPEEK